MRAKNELRNSSWIDSSNTASCKPFSSLQGISNFLIYFIAAIFLASSLPAEAAYKRGRLGSFAGKSLVKKQAPKAFSKAHKTRADQLAENRRRGKEREAATEAELRREHPNASIQKEQYLRDANGKIVKDKRTGKARRLDFVVIEKGKVIRKIETTGLHSSKIDQLEKEGRIVNQGGYFVRDRQSGKLIPVTDLEISQEIIRRYP